MSDLDDAIRELEEAWARHHKDPKNHRMPDMVELAKLRIRKRELERNAKM